MKLFAAVLLLRNLEDKLKNLKRERLDISKKTGKIEDLDASIFSLIHHIAKIDGRIKEKNSQIKTMFGNFCSALKMLSLLKEEVKFLKEIEFGGITGKNLVDVDLIKKYAQSMNNMIKTIMFDVKETNLDNDVNIEDIVGTINKEENDG